jgi:hypothetical protein
MNWKIIFQLSVFGLIMAFATVSLIPEKIEPVFWIVIYLFSAWVIAKVCNSKYFLHGFLVCLINCIWITSAHVIWYDSYIAHHPGVASQLATLPGRQALHPRLLTVIFAPIFGVVCGIVLGLFSFIASKIVKKKAA